MYRIYKITSPQEEQCCYIGKTTKKLNERFNKHKCNYKKWLNGRYHHVTSYEIMQYPDTTIELVEDDLDESQAVERERYWVSQFNTVNKQIPGRTKCEWHQDNHERIVEYKKRWHQDNHERRSENNKRWHVENREIISERRSQKIPCECGCLVARRNIASHKKTIKHQKLLASSRPAAE